MTQGSNGPSFAFEALHVFFVEDLDCDCVAKAANVFSGNGSSRSTALNTWAVEVPSTTETGFASSEQVVASV